MVEENTASETASARAAQKRANAERQTRAEARVRSEAQENSAAPANPAAKSTDMSSTGTPTNETESAASPEASSQIEEKSVGDDAAHASETPDIAAAQALLLALNSVSQTPPVPGAAETQAAAGVQTPNISPPEIGASTPSNATLVSPTITAPTQALDASQNIDTDITAPTTNAAPNGDELADLLSATGQGTSETNETVEPENTAAEILRALTNKASSSGSAAGTLPQSESAASVAGRAEPQTPATILAPSANALTNSAAATNAAMPAQMHSAAAVLAGAQPANAEAAGNSKDKYKGKVTESGNADESGLSKEKTAQALTRGLPAAETHTAQPAHNAAERTPAQISAAFGTQILASQGDASAGADSFSTPVSNMSANAAPAGTPTAPLATSADAPVRIAMHGSAAADLDAVALRIAHRAAAGDSRFDIRLDPPELGRIDVRLDVDRNGHAQAHLTADKPHTLELLQRDAAALERALRDAGLDFGGLSFALKGEGGNGNGRNGQNQSANAGGSNNPAGDEAGLSSAGRWNGFAARDDGRVDIRV